MITTPKPDLSGLKTYLVGGAVRDQLLGLPVQERDWVVVGATAKQMLDLGFSQVGKDFPVFLHPKTQEEYALARTERKQGRGYHGFTVHASKEVTLVEDLARRDLTINAIAQDENGQLVDPFNGQKDLEDRRLRHVSPAFVEDPLRVLRLARFAARFANFSVDEKTMALCQQMVHAGEVAHLTRERVWQEWQKVLLTDNPWRFIEVLVAAGAWAVIMPGCQQPSTDLQNLRRLAPQVKSTDRFALLGLYLPLSQWRQQLKMLALPKQIEELSTLVHQLVANFDTAVSSEDCLARLQQWDALRRVERFERAAYLAGLCLELPQQAQQWVAWAHELREIKPNPTQIQGMRGPEIAKHLTALRLARLELAKSKQAK